MRKFDLGKGASIPLGSKHKENLFREGLRPHPPPLCSIEGQGQAAGQKGQKAQDTIVFCGENVAPKRHSAISLPVPFSYQAPERVKPSEASFCLPA